MVNTERSLSMFHSGHYLSHNEARLAHLAELGLPLNNRSVLEPGAGIGDHTLFYLERGCHVTAIEPRIENCIAFREHMASVVPEFSTQWELIEGDALDVATISKKFDVVHCYGLLYHLSEPAEALKVLAHRCNDLFLLETCVSFGDDVRVHPVPESVENPSQSVDGIGCRPTRAWIFEQLSYYFPYIYVPIDQPLHPEFPICWTKPDIHKGVLARAIFVASHRELKLPSLEKQIIKTSK